MMIVLTVDSLCAAAMSKMNTEISGEFLIHICLCVTGVHIWLTSCQSEFFLIVFIHGQILVIPNVILSTSLFVGILFGKGFLYLDRGCLFHVLFILFIMTDFFNIRVLLEF